MNFESSVSVEPLSLLSRDSVEKIPTIVVLKNEFSTHIPSRFGKPRTYISPMNGISSIIRADCTNSGCGVRAYIHIQRDSQGQWVVVEKEPQFDRTSRSACNDCRSLLSLDQG